MRPLIHATPSVPDTDWVDFSNLLPAGLAKSASNGRCRLRRRGDRMMVDMALTVSQAGITTILPIPVGYRPDIPLLIPFAFWTSPQQDSGLPRVVDGSGYIGAGGTQLRVGTALATGTVAIYLDLAAPGPMPS